MTLKRFVFSIMTILLSLSRVALAEITSEIPKTPICYVKVEGTKQGRLKGESLQKMHREQMECLKFSYTVSSPRDVATGQATGKRQHGPVILTKEIGAATPQLFQALVTNEVLKSVLIEFVRNSPDGREEVYYTVRLNNATLSNIRQFSEGVRVLEDDSFTFQQIEIANLPGKTSASDSLTR